MDGYGTMVDIKVIFQIALKINANAIILAHNHPSGSKHPSQADIKVTNNIKEAGIMMDLKLIDHLIITQEECYSFADEGLL